MIASWYTVGNSPTAHDTECVSLQKINALLVGIAEQSGGAGGAVSVFANSISAAQAESSSSVGVGNIVFIMNAVNPGELSGYQLQAGTPTQASPFQFQPNDNSNLTYTLVF